jgi:hypothetical protein
MKEQTGESGHFFSGAGEYFAPAFSGTLLGFWRYFQNDTPEEYGRNSGFTVCPVLLALSTCVRDEERNLNTDCIIVLHQTFRRADVACCYFRRGDWVVLMSGSMNGGSFLFSHYYINAK